MKNERSLGENYIPDTRPWRLRFAGEYGKSGWLEVMRGRVGNEALYVHIFSSQEKTANTNLE